MKIAATADLHYNIARSKQSAEQLAAELAEVAPDVLILVGDLAGQRLDVLEHCFALFEPLGCPRLYVPGNHELWALPGQDSLDRYERLLPQACRDCGVHYLDGEPFVLERTAFVGNVGWYDYSFQSRRLHVPQRFYRAKVAPGVARALPQYRHLVAGHNDLGDGLLQISTRWMDGVHVTMDMDDKQFLSYLIDRMTGHLSEAASQADQIVAAVHHLPFVELVRYTDRDNWEFANAYMGSRRLGEALLAEPKVRYVFCGHSHLTGRVTKEHLTCINIGSTYTHKRYELIEL